MTPEIAAVFVTSIVSVAIIIVSAILKMKSRAGDNTKTETSGVKSDVAVLQQRVGNVEHGLDDALREFRQGFKEFREDFQGMRKDLQAIKESLVEVIEKARKA